MKTLKYATKKYAPTVNAYLKNTFGIVGTTDVVFQETKEPCFWADVITSPCRNEYSKMLQAIKAKLGKPMVINDSVGRMNIWDMVDKKAGVVRTIMLIRDRPLSPGRNEEHHLQLQQSLIEEVAA